MHLRRKSCSFVLNNMYRKPGALAIDLEANVWSLSHYVHTEKNVGETVNCLWPEDGEYHVAEITEKHSDGTYGVYFLDSDLTLERVDSSDFEPIKGT